MENKPIAQANSRRKREAGPPGRIKIVEALKSLLEEKEFASITWGDIARRAEVTEGLIYKYFNDTRQLLFRVLEEYLKIFVNQVVVDLKGIEGSLNKLRRLIWSTIHFYASNRVFARILLLEVRRYRLYFESEAYKLVREYSRILKEDIIEEGMRNGEIRDDISAQYLRDIVFGCIEHLVLPGSLFDREIDTDELTHNACAILFDTLAPKRDEE
jgi:TetR/AcrR family fatty acid metabolism transcriptional regulator